MNKVIGLLAIVFLFIILVKGLATAWLGIKAMQFAFILIGFVAIGYLWGKLTK